MSHFTLYIAGNVLAGALLLFWAIKNGHFSASKIRAASDLQEALKWLQLELLTPKIINKIFAFDDWDFVRSNTAPDVQHSFRRERTKIATLWLRQTQKQVSLLMKFQRIFASRSHDIDLRAEISLALTYYALILTCQWMIFLVWCFGPFRFGQMVSRTQTLADKICSTVRIITVALEHPSGNVTMQPE